MLLQINLSYLQKNRPDLLAKLATLEASMHADPLHLQLTPSPSYNGFVPMNGRSIPIHDPVSPSAEADRLLSPLTDKLEGSGHHVLFFGAGLGHHIKRFTELFPKVPYSIFEPSANLMHAFLSTIELEHLDRNMLRFLSIGFERNRTAFELRQLIDQIPNGLIVVALPSAVSIFKDLHERLQEYFKATIRHKQQSFYTNKNFEKMWIRNSLDNFPTTWESDSFFDYRSNFAGKPVLLVAAGPSLNEEIEHIRQIKRDRSAYIFSVGSSINTLVEHHIVPDAAFTYDPGEHTQNVYRKAIQYNMPFPLVYGSTVGPGTLDNFPWKKFYLPISQDPVFAYYADHAARSFTINDAPSIAIIALQALLKMDCSPIVLVGQNFAYHDERYYSDGVPYTGGSSNEQRLQIQGVTGGYVTTNASLNAMRMEMEAYIKSNPNCRIVNTTKHGAHIVGTIFQSLEEVISKELSPNRISMDWTTNRTSLPLFSAATLHHRLHTMSHHFGQIAHIFVGLRDALSLLCKQPAEENFRLFDQQFNALRQNYYFHYFLLPMNRTAFEKMYSEMVNIKIEADLHRRALLTSGLFGRFLFNVYEDYVDIRPKYMQSIYLLSSRYVTSEETV